VAEHFDQNIATLAVTAAALHRSKKIKLRHLRVNELFTKELFKTLEELLFEHQEEDLVLVLACVLAWDEFCTRESLQGLGGCPPADFNKSLKESLEELKTTLQDHSKEVV
jgi:hypothetical protein